LLADLYSHKFKKTYVLKLFFDSPIMTLTVTLQPSGHQFSVSRDETVLSAAIRQGIGMPYGCKDGACGSCKCKLVEGRVIHGAHQAKALTSEEEAEGWMLSCCAAPQTDLIVEARASAAGEIAPRKMPARIAWLNKAAADVMVIHLQLPASEPFVYRAGQYIEVLLRDGARRSYSMASAPHRQNKLLESGQNAIELHLRHMPGGLFTDQVFQSLKPKDILRIEGPYGGFYLREDSNRPLIFVASGTGFAPIKAMLEYMNEKSITRPTFFYWGARKQADLYQQDWVLQAVQQMPHVQYCPVLSQADQHAEPWSGRTGYVHQAVMEDFPDLSAYQVYACGAPIVVNSARHDFIEKCGLAPGEFFADAFTSEADKLAA
jgi:CDP-4-dehydro-6-deoxyglucose reductase, E3